MWRCVVFWIFINYFFTYNQGVDKTTRNVNYMYIMYSYIHIREASQEITLTYIIMV